MKPKLSIKRALKAGVALAVVVGLGFEVRHAADQRPVPLPVKAEGEQLGLTPDGRFLVQGDIPLGEISFLNLKSGKVERRRPPREIKEALGSHAMAILPDSRHVAGTDILADSSGQASIALFDLQSSEGFRVLARGEVAGSALAASPLDGSVAAFNKEGEICFWGAEGRLRRKWPPFAFAETPGGPPDPKEVIRFSVPLSLAFSPGGQQLAVGGRCLCTADKDGSTMNRLQPAPLSLWNAATGALVRQMDEPQPASSSWRKAGSDWSRVLCTSLAFSPDGQWLATGNLGNSVVVWEASTGKVSRILSHPRDPDEPQFSNFSNGSDVAFSPGNRLIAAAAIEGGVDVWDFASGSLLRHLRASGPIAFEPDGRLITSSPGRRGPILAWHT